MESSDSSKRKFVPGGGSALASGDKPGDPFATLVVLAADGLLGAPPKGGLTASTMPPLLDTALETALTLVDGAPRCVFVVTGGTVTAPLMTQVVLRMPGGLDAFGAGKRIEALLKERSAPWGSLFESALLVKALAKRQCATVRFGRVVVLTHAALSAATVRVYSHVFSDWRVLVDGGHANGGRDDALHVRAEPIDSDPPGAHEDLGLLLQRAAELDDAWFAAGLDKFKPHPWWPAEVVGAPSPGAVGRSGEASATAEGKRAKVAP